MKITHKSNGSETGKTSSYISFYSVLTGDSKSNELNASYAADGYARIKEGTLGVLTTTYANIFVFSIEFIGLNIELVLVLENCLLSMELPVVRRLQWLDIRMLKIF